MRGWVEDPVLCQFTGSIHKTLPQSVSRRWCFCRRGRCVSWYDRRRVCYRWDRCLFRRPIGLLWSHRSRYHLFGSTASFSATARTTVEATVNHWYPDRRCRQQWSRHHNLCCPRESTATAIDDNSDEDSSDWRRYCDNSLPVLLLVSLLPKHKT